MSRIASGCLERSARASWLLDPHLSPRQRQSRGFTEHLVKLQGASDRRLTL